MFYHIAADHIEAVLHALDTLGFSLQHIRTDGEHSSHDGTYSFNREYASYADFAANVHADFAVETDAARCGFGRLRQVLPGDT